jgi:hypothetical protein|tara:strand:- start:43 stop:1026 length:984 start_codon:yes stop_codon:yes gene_type:complete
MATDFKYASQSDLEMYYPSYSQYDSKRQIFGWTTTSNLHQAHNCGLVSVLFVNGDEVTASENTDEPNANGEWRYIEAQDVIQYYDDTITASDQVMEAGQDNATYFDQMLVNASMELNNLLDRRYPTPIPKYTQYDANTTHVSSATEYDAIIIKSTCYVCVANLLRTNNRQEEADYYHGLVTNVDGSGMVDRLNKGEYKLSFEVDADDSQGKPRTITQSGSMDIIETGGAYSGQAFDLLRITCTTTGAYGVAIVKVEYYGSDKLFGSETTGIKVTGGLQHIHGGWYCRFQGASMTQNDLWEVEVYSETRKISNAESGAIQLTRRGYGI